MSPENPKARDRLGNLRLGGKLLLKLVLTKLVLRMLTTFVFCRMALNLLTS